LRSSNKITITEAVPEDSHLASIWGGVFFHPSYVNSGARHLGLEGSAKSISCDGYNVGISNVLFRKRATINAATIPLLFQYFGPVFYSPELEKIFLKEILNYYKETCDYIYLSLIPEFNSIAVYGSNWTVIRRTTLAITGGEFDNWGNVFRDDVKNKIKRAGREKVRIAVSESMDENLWTVSFSRKGMKPPIEASRLAEWCRELMDSSLLRIYAAVVDNVEVAFRGQLVLGHFAYDWIAGSDPRYHNLGVNQLLMAEIGSDLRDKGVSVWDLVDGSVKGIAEFKKSFGAKEYYHWHAHRGMGIRGKLFGALRRIKNG
jgi:hypothetical protein